MTVDTIFDAASLTKVIATTPSLMKLFEQGKIRLDDPVTQYLPEFQGGQSDITIRNLMTHFSGLRPDLDLKPAWSGYETGIHRALIDKPAGPPGVRFVYSDINFILLGEIVHRLSGKMLNDYARENIFEPLGMQDTMFLPPASLAAAHRAHRDRSGNRPAAARRGSRRHLALHGRRGRPRRRVHHRRRSGEIRPNDARPRRGQRPRGSSAPTTVQKFTSPQSPADQPILRGLGWDIDSPYSSNRGDLFPIGSYGHTGFTGTSLWIDPFSRTYVILLTNAVHPHRGKSLNSLRSRVATIAAASFGITVAGREAHRIQRNHRRAGIASRGGSQGRDTERAWTFWPPSTSRRCRANESG